MEFGARHSDKCTKTEAKEFADKVAAFIQSEGCALPKMRTLVSYGGHVRLYTGDKIERLAHRRSLKFVENNADGSKLYERSKSVVIETEYISIYRTDPWTGENEWEGEAYAIRQWLKEHGEKV